MMILINILTLLILVEEETDMSYWIGSFVGSTIVLFVTMLVFVKLVQIIVVKKGINLQIRLFKHALILAIVLGVLANTIFTPNLMGQLSVLMIILAIVGLFI